MAIVHQRNKKSGTVYVYESISYWDKKKKQSRARRKCIGKLDPTTKKIVPTRPKSPSLKAQPQMDAVTKGTSCKFYGSTYLFNAIGKKIGIIDDLKKCFPTTFKQILSLAYYLILEDRNPLSRFPRWASTHKHPYENNISSQRSSELFASITDDARERFFQLQGKRRVEKEYLAYDTTSVSSYSESLNQVKYGVNKEHDPLAQINLALLFGEESNLPFYYRKLAGNISDVKTIKNLLADISHFDYDKIKLTLDRGFYSRENIDALYKEHLKFLIATKLSLKFVQTELEKTRDTIRTWSHYNQQYNLYVTSRPITWEYRQKRPYKKDILKGKRRMYLHIYFNSMRATEEETKLNTRISQLKQELESNKRKPEHEKQYAKYFNIKNTPIKGLSVAVKQDALDNAKKNYGYFALISNEIKDPIKALERYRNKDVVEKAFHNLKDRLGIRRLAVSSEVSLDGKIFVEFIALIFLSYLKKIMQDKKLYKDYTMQEVLDELDVIQCFERPNCKLRVGEITKRQEKLFETMEVLSPNSLQ